MENDPIGVRLNLKDFILISCAVMELLRKVSQGAESAPPPGEMGLKYNLGKRVCIHGMPTGILLNFMVRFHSSTKNSRDNIDSRLPSQMS